MAGLAACLVVVLAAVVLSGRWTPAAQAQEAPRAKSEKPAEADKRARAALEQPEPAKPQDPRDAPAAILDQMPAMNLWELTLKGGPLMIPIGMFSVLVVALGIERTIALRRRNILPRLLIQGLKSASRPDRGIDPQEAYQLCLEFPSNAANVIRAMLLKANRPHVEIREAVNEASQREVDRLTGPVRWLTLSASVAPMLGLLGTVQGMIQAFFITAHLPPGANKAVYLASSIYVALVTTFGGLSVAIPAAMLAHLFNGRVLKLFHELDQVLLVLESQLRRFQRHRRSSRRRGGVVPPPPPVDGLGPPVEQAVVNPVVSRLT
jgi:biopolymer transport protein ExbB